MFWDGLREAHRGMSGASRRLGPGVHSVPDPLRVEQPRRPRAAAGHGHHPHRGPTPNAAHHAPPQSLRAPNRKPGRSHIPFLAESAVLREALGPELYEAVLAVRRAEAELFAMFTDADVIEAVRWRY
ncbi:hypothetical protein TNCT6_68360 [Streptomyces sp. 6-11-2]|nr:hypothetical protein TNCT6_68360 [Streptomyces sp. 6-11-2]